MSLNAATAPSDPGFFNRLRTVLDSVSAVVTSAVTAKTVSISLARTCSATARNWSRVNGGSSGTSRSIAAIVQSVMSASTEPWGFWVKINRSFWLRWSTT